MKKNKKKALLSLLTLCALMVISALPVYAADTADTAEAKVVKYADAVKMANKDLSGVLALEDNIKPIKEQRQDLQDQLDQITEKFKSYGINPPSRALAPLKGAITQLSRQINSLRLSQDMIKISTEMSLLNSLANIDNYEMDIALLTDTVALNEVNLRQVELRHQLGLASDNDLRAAEQSLAQNKTNLETQQINLASERQTLNRILQLPLTQAVTVEYERKLNSLPADLSAYIKDKGKNEPTIKQKQITVDMKNSDLKDNQDPTQELTLQLNYDKAVRDRDDAKLALEAAIRANYNNLDQLLKREESLQVDLDKSMNNYRTMEANLAAGRVTQYDLDNVALSIVNCENAIEKNKNSIWTLQFAFAHPFMLAN